MKIELDLEPGDWNLIVHALGVARNHWKLSIIDYRPSWVDDKKLSKNDYIENISNSLSLIEKKIRDYND